MASRSQSEFWPAVVNPRWPFLGLTEERGRRCLRSGRAHSIFNNIIFKALSIPVTSLPALWSFRKKCEFSSVGHININKTGELEKKSFLTSLFLHLLCLMG